MRPIWLPAAVLAVGLLACSSDSTGTTAASLDLTGNWTVTKYEFTQVASPNTKMEFVAQGYTVTLVGTTSAWTITAIKTGVGTDIEQGTYTSTSTGASFYNSKSAGTTTFTWSQSGNTVTFTGGGTTFDFGSGSAEAATLAITATKQ